jgi:hypothetical protein
MPELPDDQSEPDGAGPGAASGLPAGGRHHPSRNWSRPAANLAMICLVGSALAHVLGLATPLLNALLMTGILLAGTTAWLVQARQVCPECGRRYGYRFRLVNAATCRHCGGEFEL